MSTGARSVSGVVRDAAGRPVAQARVYFLKGPVALPDTALLTGRDGRFAMSAPQPGTYDVGCTSDAHGSASARVTVGNADVTLDLQLPR